MRSITLRRPKVYLETFLTRPRFYTENYERVTRSRIVYGPDPHRPGWATSGLGILNALSVRGWRLSVAVVVAEDDRTYIVGLRLLRFET